MSIFLGSIYNTGKGNPTSYDEAEKYFTPKLIKIENLLRNYYYERLQRNNNPKKEYSTHEKILNQRGYRDLELKWEKEIESIQRKNGFFVGHYRWAYSVGDILA